MTRRSLLLGGAALLAGCETMSIGASGPTVDAPAYRVGDRWVYRVEDGFRVKVTWEEAHEVVGIDANGIRVRVTQRGPSTSNERTETWAAPGRLRVGAVFDEETRRFKEDLRYLDFPLVPGKTWNQWVGNYNEELRREGDLNRYATVGSWRTISTPAGTFDAVAVTINMRLDDEEFWRHRTFCWYRAWYAPSVRGFVREDKDAEYAEKGDNNSVSRIRSQHAVLELVSFTPGRA